jgi:hypothetical protein
MPCIVNQLRSLNQILEGKQPRLNVPPVVRSSVMTEVLPRLLRSQPSAERGRAGAKNN